MTATSIPHIEKQQFQNRSGGWIGVVLIGPKGDEQGHAVEPDGTVWLSEAEQILTARAPRRDEDNPFVEQEWTFTDPVTGSPKTIRFTPLVPVSEERWVPASNRPIPGVINSSEAPGATTAGHVAGAAKGDAPQTVVTDQRGPHDREAEVTKAAREGEDVKPNVPSAPPRAAAAAAAADDAPDEETAGDTPDEETASTAATGAASEPSGETPVGSYQANEEVGTPDAPNPPAERPRPWTPQDDPAKVPPSSEE